MTTCYNQYMHLLIDLGGTNTRVGISPDGVQLTTYQKFATAQTLTKQRELLMQTCRALLKSGHPEKLCIGIAGIVERPTPGLSVVESQNQTFKTIPNIPYLTQTKVCDLLDFTSASPLAATKVFIENDAALAGLAEASLLTPPSKVVAYLTLSTGVGGARLVHNKIDPSFKYFEPGHMIINVTGKYNTSCKQYGCAESYLSGPNFELIYNQSPKTCTDPKIWEDYATNLVAALTTLCAMWAPDTIILGGGISQKYDVFMPAVTKLFLAQTFLTPPNFKQAVLGDRSGLLGGISYLKTH